MKLSELAKETDGILTGDAEIASLCTDSRVATAGDLFFCYRGVGEDLHEFAKDAAEKGASALVVERPLELPIPQLVVSDGRAALAKIAAAFYNHPERSMTIVGVTGTNGKTTTTHMLAKILEEDGKKAGLIGTLGATYCGKKIPPSLTTPDPTALFALLADMKKAGCEAVVMETSAHALFLKKDLPIRYRIGIFTNLTQDHLDFFGDMVAYGNAKKSMFERVDTAILNADDRFSAELGGAETITYGIDSPSDCFAMPEREDMDGSRCIFNLNDAICEVNIPLIGRYNLYNALAAGAAAQKLGVGLRSIVSGLKKVSVEGRLERVAKFNGATIFVDFAHTPDGLEKSLSALREYTYGRLVVLFGCGGNRDREKRPVMGELAARLADFAYLTSDNPRYEDSMQIIRDIEKGYGKISDEYVIVENRERAIELAIMGLSEGDVLLVAGKGGEEYREVMGIKYEYNDKAVIKSVLGSL